MVTKAVTTAQPAAAPTEAAPAAKPADPAAKVAEPAKDQAKVEAPKVEAENFTEKLRAAMRGEEPPPEPGDIDLKAPDGAPEHVVGLVRDVAKMAKIPQETAQKALDLVHQKLLQQQAEFTKTQVEAAAKELWNHPELGGRNLSKTMAQSKDFIERFVPAEHRERLLGKHEELPAFLHVAFATAAKRISPDTFVPGTPGPSSKEGSDSDARAIFARSLPQKGTA